MKKKLVIPILIASMLGSSLTAYGANFYDISDVPWDGAKTYINSVADLKLMVGSLDAKGRTVFKAKDNLTYLECSQLVYSLFKETKGFTEYSATIKTKWQPVLKGYNITEWAWEPVSFCLENGIVSVSDISGFMNGNTSKNAARQDVAVMFGKSMEKAGYTQTKAVSFSDAATITPGALKYINLLGSIDILSGDQNKNFNPVSLINRAEMSVVVSKAHSKLNGNSTTPVTPADPAQTSGSILGIVTDTTNYGNQRLITIQTSTGKKGFLVDSKSTISYNGKSYTPSDIAKGDTVTVAYLGSVANSIIITNKVDAGATEKTETTAKETFKGTLTALSDTRITVKTGTTTSETLRSFTDNLDVVIDGRSRSLNTLISDFDDANRKDDINVTVYVNEKDEVFKIEASYKSDIIDGEVVTASDTKVKIDNETYYFADEKDVTIKINNKTVSISDFVKAFDKYDDFKAEVKTNSKDEITSLIITSKSYPGNEISGEVGGVSTSRVKIDGVWYTFEREQDMDVIRLDGSRCDLQDIVDAYNRYDKVTADVILNSNDDVVEIYASTKGDSKNVNGTLQSITNREIKVGGKTYRVSSNNVKVDVDNGRDSFTSYSRLMDFYDGCKADFDLELVVVDDYAEEIYGRLVSVKDAELRSIDDRNETFEIYTGRYEYEIRSNATITVDGRDKNLDWLSEELAEKSVDIDFEINSSGYVTSIDATVR